MEKIIRLIKMSCNIAYNTVFNTRHIAKEIKTEEAYNKTVTDFYENGRGYYGR